jgi:methylamine---glutamate N-methyltransferase subunit A
MRCGVRTHARRKMCGTAPYKMGRSDITIGRMCGIVGLFSKSSAVSERLGEHLAAMLVQLGDRGPDSAGVAVFRDPVGPGSCKVSVFSPEPGYDWRGLATELAGVFGGDGEPAVRATHAVVVLDVEAAEAQAYLREHHPELRVMSAGREIEIYKEAGLPADVVAQFGLGDVQGSHALGHTRMATESRVTTEHSHPFSTGLDLCLVHNGSLSNHNRLRRMLRREGIDFQTDNDSEVAAGYLMWRMREGDTLEAGLERCLVDLDGFYTFAVGSADGFAVLRDPIACKPAVLAETDDWVAMASEYRAIAILPGAEDARVWEPAPGRVYAWERERV